MSMTGHRAASVIDDIHVPGEFKYGRGELSFRGEDGVWRKVADVTSMHVREVLDRDIRSMHVREVPIRDIRPPAPRRADTAIRMFLP